ncbi:MAG: adenylate/guanylate cyclase domain-containing protein [Aeromicrobium sp.]|nr:adenylate/guanylate cyclase domain-containing protein [Burkholderiales bacterium]
MSSVMDHSDRTFIGSVVFVDIVGYSKKSVSEQITMKNLFTGLLSDSLKDIAADQRIILDTGDGAALSFLGDPEDALSVGMNMRDLLRKASPNAPEPAEDATSTGSDLFLRIGINLGPIKLVRDFNGQPNIVGDGINVAQRIMSFARPGQVVVSRSYYNVVSVVSEEYAQLFRYEGSRTDKHVREHEIYIVGESAAAFDKARSGMEDRAAATNPRNKVSYQKPTEKTPAPNPKPQPAATERVTATGDDSTQVPFMQDKKKLTAVGGGLGLLVLILAVMVATKKPAETTATKAEILAAAPAQTAPAQTVGAGSTAAATALVALGVDTKLDNAKVELSSASPSSPAAKNSAANPATNATPLKPDSAKFDATKADGVKALPAVPPMVPIAQGTLVLAIQPWGEVLVNGKSIGVSPPLKQHKLAPGKYKIEVRNSTFTPFVSNVEVKAREELNIRHKFN